MPAGLRTGTDSVSWVEAPGPACPSPRGVRKASAKCGWARTVSPPRPTSQPRPRRSWAEDPAPASSPWTAPSIPARRPSDSASPSAEGRPPGSGRGRHRLHPVPASTVYPTAVGPVAGPLEASDVCVRPRPGRGGVPFHPGTRLRRPKAHTSVEPGCPTQKARARVTHPRSVPHGSPVPDPSPVRGSPQCKNGGWTVVRKIFQERSSSVAAGLRETRLCPSTAESPPTHLPKPAHAPTGAEGTRDLRRHPSRTKVVGDQSPAGSGTRHSNHGPQHRPDHVHPESGLFDLGQGSGARY